MELLVGEGLQELDQLIILRIAVLLAADLPNPLQSIDDDQCCIRMSGDELLQLSLQPVGYRAGFCNQIEAVAALHTEHPGQAFLEPCVVILERQIEHRSLPDRVIPERDPGCDMVGQLCHKK